MRRKVTPHADQVIQAEADNCQSAEDWIREQLKLGDEAAKRGEIVPFDADAIKRAGRARLHKHDKDAE